MPVAEIASAITSLKAAFDLTKAMIGVRDATVLQGKVVDLRSIIMEAQASAIDAREAHAAQIDRIRDLEAEIVGFKAWDAEKERYELKTVGTGVVAYMLKPDSRGAQPPHWLCPNCYSKGKKSFFQATGATIGRARVFKCVMCESIVTVDAIPAWL